MTRCKFRPRLTRRSLLIAVAFSAFLIWTESRRREWANRDLCYSTFCEQEIELLKALNSPIVIGYCGLATPRQDQEKSKQMEGDGVASLLAEFEYFREKKAKYGR